MLRERTASGDIMLVITDEEYTKLRVAAEDDALELQKVKSEAEYLRAEVAALRGQLATMVGSAVNTPSPVITTQHYTYDATAAPSGTTIRTTGARTEDQWYETIYEETFKP